MIVVLIIVGWLVLSALATLGIAATVGRTQAIEERRWINEDGEPR